MTRCWCCSKEDDQLVDFAYVESPERPVLEAHPECIKKSGLAEALVPAKK